MSRALSSAGAAFVHAGPTPTWQAAGVVHSLPSNDLRSQSTRPRSERSEDSISGDRSSNASVALACGAALASVAAGSRRSRRKSCSTIMKARGGEAVLDFPTHSGPDIDSKAERRMVPGVDAASEPLLPNPAEAVKALLQPPAVSPLMYRTNERLRKYPNILAALMDFPWKGAMGPVIDSIVDSVEAPWQAPIIIHELDLIRPSNPYFLQHLFDVVQSTAHLRSQVPEGVVPTMGSYISFGRVACNYHAKVGCDWCAICNGTAEYLIDLLVASMESPDFSPLTFALDGMPQETSIRWLMRWHRLLPHSASSMHHENSPFLSSPATLRVRAAITTACRRSFGKDESAATEEAARLFEVVRPLLEMRWFYEAVEQRWCPFQHPDALKLALSERSYYTFGNKPEELETALRLLREDSHIDCRRCASELERIAGDEVPAEMPEGFKGEAIGGLIVPLHEYYDELLSLHQTSADRR
eukprot:TRINITY_DN7434_c0_g1_i2.p1 TRINITY_DN7434_c0_g1~~TRINITY_DN7434_c0_g1_i2.p1  ORF type:complete len:471 (-),score=91.29 TRINITY_DN7434_c0_g1_i2:135-1547(-)